jgi:hypothetical protein
MGTLSVEKQEKLEADAAKAERKAEKKAEAEAKKKEVCDGGAHDEPFMLTPIADAQAAKVGILLRIQGRKY